MFKPVSGPISEKRVLIANHTGSTLVPAVPEIPSPPLAVVEQKSSILDIVDSDNLPASSLKQPGEAVIIDVDAFEYEDTLKRPKMSAAAAACEGYAINFPDGKSPHTTYPFALHNTIILPWDYAVNNGVMKLFARSCRGLVSGGSKGVLACQPCRSLAKNETLEGILTRMKVGVHENAGFAYHGFSSLLEILHRKNQQIEFYRLRELKQAKKVLVKAAFDDERSEMKKIWAKQGKVTTKHTKQSTIPPLVISERHRVRVRGIPHFPEGEEVTEITEDEEDTEEEEIGADLVGVGSVEREEAGEDREMRADFASVRNSTGFEVDAVPITVSEPPIGDNNNQTAESGSGNEASVNNAGVGNVNYIQPAAATATKIPEESGQSKRKRVLRKPADALDGCLCGLVLNRSMEGVLQCKQAGCETQWYHLQCVELEREPRSWACVACEESEREKRQRR